MIRRRVAANFREPKGLYGWIAGRIMATRDSNVRRNAWIASILAPAPDARILEIGHGPGLAIEHLTPGLTTGRLVGVEISPLMSRAAARRNRAAVRTGRVEFRVADSADLPADLHEFDLILSVNASMFWTDPQSAIDGLADRLATGGELVLVYMPPPGTDRSADEVAAQHAEHLRAAGLTDIRHDRMDYTPVAIATRGHRP